MRRSRDRILTTHTGSLPRPADLDQLIADRETGVGVDQAGFDKRVEQAVADIVASQLVAGVSESLGHEQSFRVGDSTNSLWHLMPD